jgi:hypothetical protein
METGASPAKQKIRLIRNGCTVGMNAGRQWLMKRPAGGSRTVFQ